MNELNLFHVKCLNLLYCSLLFTKFVQPGDKSWPPISSVCYPSGPQPRKYRAATGRDLPPFQSWCILPFGHYTWVEYGAAVPYFGEGEQGAGWKWAENWELCPFRGAGSHVTQCGWGRGLSPCQVSSWSIQPFGCNTPTL